RLRAQHAPLAVVALERVGGRYREQAADFVPADLSDQAIEQRLCATTPPRALRSADRAARLSDKAAPRRGPAPNRRPELPRACAAGPGRRSRPAWRRRRKKARGDCQTPSNRSAETADPPDAAPRMYARSRNGRRGGAMHTTAPENCRC